MRLTPYFGYVTEESGTAFSYQKRKNNNNNNQIENAFPFIPCFLLRQKSEITWWHAPLLGSWRNRKANLLLYCVFPLVARLKNRRVTVFNQHCSHLWFTDSVHLFPFGRCPKERKLDTVILVFVLQSKVVFKVPAYRILKTTWSHRNCKKYNQAEIGPGEKGQLQFGHAIGGCTDYLPLRRNPNGNFNYHHYKIIPSVHRKL